MADERAEGQRLVDRLQQQIDRFQRMKLTGDSAKQLRDAIDELQKDVEDLKVVAPFVFVPPPPRGRR
jgi:hypothetical protein